MYFTPKSTIFQPIHQILPLPSPHTHRQSIQFSSQLGPVGEVVVHEGFEVVVVVSLEEVHHFVDDYVLNAVEWFFSQFQVEEDAFFFDVAGAPFGGHAADAEAGELDADFLLPFGDQGWD